jgi:hypothetical protein
MNFYQSTRHHIPEHIISCPLFEVFSLLSLFLKQVLGTTNCLLSFDLTRAAYKTKKLWDTHTDKEDDLLRLLTKMSGDTQIDSKMMS